MCTTISITSVKKPTVFKVLSSKQLILNSYGFNSVILLYIVEMAFLSLDFYFSERM